MQRTSPGGNWNNVELQQAEIGGGRSPDMSLYHGGSTSRLCHISEDQSGKNFNAAASISPSAAAAVPSSYGSTVLSHVPPEVVTAETAESHSQPSSDAIFPTPPDSQASSQDSSQSSSSSDPQSTKFNTNTNNILSHPQPPPLIHVEPQEQPSLETTSRLCHAGPLSGPPQLIPIALKTEPDAIWHATLRASPWPVPPNAPSGEESGVPAVSRTTDPNSSKCIMPIV